MGLGRREFLRGCLAGAAGSLLGCVRRDKGEQAACFDPYEIVLLGKTGIKVSRTGLGTGMSGYNRQSNQTRLGKEMFENLLRTNYDRGVRLFDMADLYGTHEYLPGALNGLSRDSYVIVSKIWFAPVGLPETERPDADVAVERFLRELKTDYIDLILLHCMTEPDWVGKYDRQMNILAGLKKKGVIRAHGVSCHSLAALRQAADEPWVDSIHTRINPFGVSMDAEPQRVVPVLRQAHSNGKGIIGMKVMGAGKFRDDEQKKNESIDFVFNLGCVDATVVGFESIAELDDFAARVRSVPRRNKPVLI